MDVKLEAIASGTYIVAVSGGVDSMALLDLLRRQPGLRLQVAHINHSMRTDSDLDEQLVAAFCASHNIPYVSKKLHLGQGASEAAARDERYKYLRYCRDKYKAQAIITAHHEDDLIETALIAILRGTGWRGLAPFTHTPDVLRPLAGATKQELIDYATAHSLPWREDSTNTDERYLRNYVRHTLVPFLQKRSSEWRADFLRLIRNQQALRRTIEDELTTKLTACVAVGGTTIALHRYYWIMLPRPEAYELFQAMCRTHLGHSVVRNLALQALLFMNTAKPGKRMPLGAVWQLRAEANQIIVESQASMLS